MLLLLVAVTRPLFWLSGATEVDEILMLNGVDHLDIANSSPHPPGFPYFILLGKALALLTGSGLVALQLVGLLGAVAGVIGVDGLAYWLTSRRDLSLWAAALYAFAPAQWALHGSAFSDASALGFLLLAFALLVKEDARNRSAEWLLAAFFAALALGIRPTYLPLFIWPWLLFSIACARSGRWKAWGMHSAALLVLCIPILVIVCVNVGGLSAAIQKFGAYLASTQPSDSARPDHLGGWLEILHRQWLEPFGWNVVGVITGLLALFGLTLTITQRSQSRTRVVTLAVLPYSVLAASVTNLVFAPRFGLPTQVLLVLLVVVGVSHLPTRRLLSGALSAALCIAFIAWSLPILRVVRSSDPPMSSALSFLQKEHARSPRSILVEPLDYIRTKRAVPDMEVFGEVWLPYLPQWRLMTNVHEFFDADRRPLRLAREPYPGLEPLFVAKWRVERFGRISRPAISDVYVYEEPARALHGPGWQQPRLSTGDVIRVAYEKACLFVPNTVHRVRFEISPASADLAGVEATLSVFPDEAWADPAAESLELCSVVLKSGKWVRVESDLDSDCRLSVRALLLECSGSELPAHLPAMHVRRLRTEFAH